MRHVSLFVCWVVTIAACGAPGPPALSREAAMPTGEMLPLGPPGSTCRVVAAERGVEIRNMLWDSPYFWVVYGDGRVSSFVTSDRHVSDMGVCSVDAEIMFVEDAGGGRAQMLTSDGDLIVVELASCGVRGRTRLPRAVNAAGRCGDGSVLYADASEMGVVRGDGRMEPVLRRPVFGRLRFVQYLGEPPIAEAEVCRLCDSVGCLQYWVEGQRVEGVQLPDIYVSHVYPLSDRDDVAYCAEEVILAPLGHGCIVEYNAWAVYLHCGTGP